MRLYVNIDHVATIREARGTNEPDPVRAAVLVELAGADGITVHLREDRRHIQDRDVRLLAETCRTALNLEVAAEPEMVRIATDLRPAQVTLVPERRQEITTEGGLDLGSEERLDRLRRAIDPLSEAGIRVSLFIDPDPAAVDVAERLGVPAIEFHTGEYANARGDEAKQRELERLLVAADRAWELGVSAHAGHGLTYENVIPIATIDTIEELNIGHSIVSRAVLTGLEKAVRDMVALIRRAPDRSLDPGTWTPPIGY